MSGGGPANAASDDIDVLAGCLADARDKDNVKMMLKVAKALGVVSWPTVCAFEEWWHKQYGKGARDALEEEREEKEDTREDEQGEEIAGEKIARKEISGKKEEFRKRLMSNDAPSKEAVFADVVKDVYKAVLKGGGGKKQFDENLPSGKGGKGYGGCGNGGKGNKRWVKWNGERWQWWNGQWWQWWNGQWWNGDGQWWNGDGQQWNGENGKKERYEGGKKRWNKGWGMLSEVMLGELGDETKEGIEKPRTLSEWNKLLRFNTYLDVDLSGELDRKHIVDNIADALYDALKSEHLKPVHRSQLLLHMLDVSGHDPYQILRYHHNIHEYPAICDILFNKGTDLFPVSGKVHWHLDKYSPCFEDLNTVRFKSYEMMTFFTGKDDKTGAAIIQLNCSIDGGKDLFYAMKEWSTGQMEAMKPYWENVRPALKWNEMSPLWEMEGFRGCEDNEAVQKLFKGLEDAVKPVLVEPLKQKCSDILSSLNVPCMMDVTNVAKEALKDAMKKRVTSYKNGGHPKIVVSAALPDPSSSSGMVERILEKISEGLCSTMTERLANAIKDCGVAKKCLEYVIKKVFEDPGVQGILKEKVNRDQMQKAMDTCLERALIEARLQVSKKAEQAIRESIMQDANGFDALENRLLHEDSEINEDFEALLDASLVYAMNGSNPFVMINRVIWQAVGEMVENLKGKILENIEGAVKKVYSYRLRMKGTSAATNELLDAVKGGSEGELLEILLKKGMNGVNWKYLRKIHESKQKDNAQLAKEVEELVKQDVSMNIELRVPLTFEEVKYFGGVTPKYKLHVNIHLNHPDKYASGRTTEETATASATEADEPEEEEEEWKKNTTETITEAVKQHIENIWEASQSGYEFRSLFTHFKEKLAKGVRCTPCSQNSLSIGYNDKRACRFIKTITFNSPSPFHELQRHGAVIQVVQQIKGYPYDPAARFGEAWEYLLRRDDKEKPLELCVATCKEYTLLPTKRYEISRCDLDGNAVTGGELPRFLLAKSGTTVDTLKYRGVYIKEKPIPQCCVEPPPYPEREARRAYRYKKQWDLLKPLYPADFSEAPPYLVQELQMSLWEAVKFCGAKSKEEIVFITVNWAREILEEEGLESELTNGFSEDAKFIAVLPVEGETEKLVAYCGLQWSVGHAKLNFYRLADSCMWEKALEVVEVDLEAEIDACATLTCMNFEFGTEGGKKVAVLWDVDDSLRDKGLVPGLIVMKPIEVKRKKVTKITLRPSMGARLPGRVVGEPGALRIKPLLCQKIFRYANPQDVKLLLGDNVQFSLAKKGTNTYYACGVVVSRRTSRTAPTSRYTTESMRRYPWIRTESHADQETPEEPDEELQPEAQGESELQVEQEKKKKKKKKNDEKEKNKKNKKKKKKK